MPIYQYQAATDKSCAICRKGFEIRRPVERPPLEQCPLCRNPVKKLISAVNTPRVAKPLSLSDAKSAGFTVLQRRDEGVYERL
jgi:putative FmdB family regulatory protein